MPLATLADILPLANRERYAVAGLVCLGWEDASAYAAAAEDLAAPVILQAGPSARAHMPLSVWGAVFRHLGERASVPVVAHLDHGKTRAECEEAIASGFTSVMFDGSALPLDENIAQTAAIARMAHESGVSCEGEIGFVGYAAGERDAEASAMTDPDEAARFASETGVDAMAVSVGNVHLQQTGTSALDFNAVAAIQGRTDVPLVIHGASGVSYEQRRRLARETNVAKLNVGTELRRLFGDTLRGVLAKHPERFDRIAILRDTTEPLRAAAREVIAGLR